MGKFSLKGLKGGLKGLGGKVKLLGGKATNKGKDWLKEKWAGKLQTSSQPAKKDEWAEWAGVPAEVAAAMRGEGQKTEEAKKPSIGKQPTPEQKEEAMRRIRGEHARDEEIERIKEFYEGKKKIGFNTQNIGKKIGGVIASGVMMAAAYGGAFLYFPEFTQLILIVGGIALFFIIISMFVKNAGGYLFLGFFAVSGFALWQVGILTPFIDQYLPPVADALQNMWVFVTDVWFNTQCILSNPANADACMKARQRNATESVNKLGPYETVEIKWGRRLDGSYDTDPVESGQDYTLDVSFFNKNNAVYEINFTEINAYTTITVGENPTVTYNTTPKSAFTGGRYTLDPKEELPIRFKTFDLPDDWSCLGSQTFKVNATTEQKSGGWSDFGMAPSDEDNFRNFIHKFNPHINAEPGPLNIYVYTDPWGISAEDFIGVTGDDRVEVIIKIQNKVKTGTAEIDKLYLVQNFEIPATLFTINIEDCIGTGRLIVTPMQITPIIPVIPGETTTTTMPITNVIVERKSVEGVANCAPNCLEFTFSPTLKIKPDGKITISCRVDVNELPPAEYTDQIRVFADFRYTQEWTNPIPCLTYA